MGRGLMKPRHEELAEAILCPQRFSGLKSCNTKKARSPAEWANPSRQFST
jgi:hypothetical protein